MKQQRLKLSADAETQKARKLSIQEQYDADNQYAALYYEEMGFGGAFAAFSEAVFKRLGRPPWEERNQ